MAKIKELHNADRPRERLLQLGAKSLTNVELLAILLRTGTEGKSAIELAQELLQQMGTLRNLFNASIAELSKIKGIKKAKITTLLAAIELAHRYSKEFYSERLNFSNPEDVYNYCKTQLANLTREVFLVLYLNSKNQLIGEEQLGSSLSNSCICHPQEFLRGLFNRGASKLILIHNHPSGDVSPSQKDIDFTVELSSHLLYFGFELLDHLKVSNRGYYSMKNGGIIK